MNAFKDFQQAWLKRFPDCPLPGAWEEDVRANLAKHSEKVALLKEDLKKEQFYVEYLEGLLSDVEQHKKKLAKKNAICEEEEIQEEIKVEIVVHKEVDEDGKVGRKSNEGGRDALLKHICSKCGRTFKAAFRLRFHMKSCMSEGFPCPICQKVSKAPERLQQHIRFVHYKERLHSCSECNKEFQCLADLNAHFNIHKGVRFKCDYCDSTFSNISNKKKHNKRYH